MGNFFVALFLFRRDAGLEKHATFCLKQRNSKTIGWLSRQRTYCLESPVSHSTCSVGLEIVRAVPYVKLQHT
jgi:hypothetical protein